MEAQATKYNVFIMLDSTYIDITYTDISIIRGGMLQYPLHILANVTVYQIIIIVTLCAIDTLS